MDPEDSTLSDGSQYMNLEVAADFLRMASFDLGRADGHVTNVHAFLVELRSRLAGFGAVTGEVDVAIAESTEISKQAAALRDRNKALQARIIAMTQQPAQTVGEATPDRRAGQGVLVDRRTPLPKRVKGASFEPPTE